MNRLTCQAVIFDLDGVLVDSTAVVERSWRRWATSHGLEFDEIMQIAHGRRAAETMRIAAPHLDADAETARMAAEEVHDTDGMIKIEGAAQFVRSLPEGRWAVATSATREIATARLTFVGISTPAVLITADDIRRGKPDPWIYVLAAERLGVSPERCVVIEDAPVGIQGARAAGMPVIAVSTTHPREALQGADAVVECLSDIRASTDDVGRITLFVGGDHATAD